METRSPNAASSVIKNGHETNELDGTKAMLYMSRGQVVRASVD